MQLLSERLLADTAMVFEENKRLREAVRALADAAELVAEKAHIVQPFLTVFKEHGATIEGARQRRATIGETVLGKPTHMSIAPTREETAHGAGYNEASDFYGKMLDGQAQRIKALDAENEQLRKRIKTLDLDMGVLVSIINDHKAALSASAK